MGDLHCDKLAHLFGAERSLELQYNEWCKSADYALEHGIKNWYQMGDVADKPRLSEEARVWLLRFMHKYDGLLEQDWILGNHDTEYEGYHSMQQFEEMAKMGMFKSIRFHCVKKQVVVGGVPINFLPFPEKKAMPYRKGGETLNLAHLERPGAIRDNGTRMDLNHGTPEEGSDHWVIGHLHTQQMMGNSWFVGTPYQTNFGESLPKGFGVLRAKRLTSGKLKIEREFIETQPGFTLHNLKVEKVSDLKKIADDPLKLYKVVVKRGVELPYDVGARHPNVVNNVVTYKTDKQAETLLADTDTEIKFGITDNLHGELKTRGHNKAQRKRGEAIVSEILPTIGV